MVEQSWNMHGGTVLVEQSWQKSCSETVMVKWIWRNSYGRKVLWKSNSGTVMVQQSWLNSHGGTVMMEQSWSNSQGKKVMVKES